MEGSAAFTQRAAGDRHPERRWSEDGVVPGRFEVSAQVGGAVGLVAEHLDRLVLDCQEVLGDLRLVVGRACRGTGRPR
ncbi:hypothetical protein ACWEKM_14565 [Streptomyces sp. NPDC004752]